MLVGEDEDPLFEILYLLEQKDIFVLLLRKTWLDEPKIGPTAAQIACAVRRVIGVAEEALFPSTHMRHKAKPSQEYLVARSMHASGVHHPISYHATEENPLAKKLDANDWVVDEEEKKLETVLVFFSYYSLEIS